MTKDQLLREIYRQNPMASQQGLNLSKEGVLKFYNLVWDTAYAYGKKVEQDASQVTTMDNHPGDWPSIMCQIFGKN